MVVVTRSLAEETTIMTESTLSMANTPATTFSSIVITTSLKDVLLPTSSSAFTSVYTQQQGQSILLTTASSAALSSSVLKATTSRPMSPSPKETEAGIQHKAKAVLYVYCICITMWYSHLMIWKILKQSVLFPKGLNWVQH